jgi:hypothetical protein
MTQIVTGRLDSSAQRDAETLRAQLAQQTEERQADDARKSAAQTLQTDLIKKFAEAPDLVTARGNLKFLVDAGLLPDYEKQVTKYLDANPEAVPRVSSREFSPDPVAAIKDALFDPSTKKVKPAQLAKLKACWADPKINIPPDTSITEFMFSQEFNARRVAVLECLQNSVNADDAVNRPNSRS